jgi:flagellar basal body rod protein FlgG
MSTIPSSSISQMGMQAAAKQQQASAHNVSNLNTDGFQAVEIVQEMSAQGGVTTDVRHTGDSAPMFLRGQDLVQGSNTDLVRESVNQISALGAYRANAAAFKAADEMTDELLKILA